MDDAPAEKGLSEPPSKIPDKTRRDEWSEGGVLSLLDVYESKWQLRNRAKLKGTDWEDIARQVSDRCCRTKGVKSPNQCKNKIESMKKRYRAESAGGGGGASPGSSWQFYARMDGLLKGVGAKQAKASTSSPNGVPKLELDDSERRVGDGKGKDCDLNELDPNGQAQESNRDGGSNTLDGDASTLREEGRAKQRRSSGSDVAESIRLLAKSILKIEKARMEMHKDSERMRVEAEIQRGELELKKTEIIAKTQLQIVKLLTKRLRGRGSEGGCSSGPDVVPSSSADAEGRNGPL
ncbi:hypothetical protein QJS04_geneDACA022879 [Acorus gramineus]|uniref:Myb/SANT-like DNA-binding domain-containing protein n=1 Tax=Acorus gramineus TaxID=55184 RepID=A0AAV9AZG1_ACOGR|nr:hypothetical protein QJS04_geneDACA022879 [Acorus gramineus]